MPILPITVPGAKSVINIVTFNTDANTGFQNALFGSLQQGLLNAAATVVTDPTVQPSTPAVLSLAETPPSPAFSLAPNVTGFVNRATGAVTVTGNTETNQTILAGGGAMTFVAVPGESGTLAAGSGTLTFIGPSQKGGSWTVLLDDTEPGAANTVIAGSSSVLVQDRGGEKNTIVLGSGAATVGAFGQDSIVAGSGASTIFFNGGGTVLQGDPGPLLVVANQGGNTVLGGTGAETIFANAGGNTVIGGSSSVVYVAQPSTAGSLFDAGAGDATIFALSGSSGTYQTGSGHFTFVATSGSVSTLTGAQGEATAVVFGNAGSDVVFDGNAIGNILVAAGANTTLNASGSAGGDIFFNRVAAGQSATLIGGSYYNFFVAGPGNATMAGGPGHNFFQFVAGEDGGSNLIMNWNANDQIDLFGYTPNEVSTATSGGATVITLSDGTTITVQGAAVPKSALHIG